MDLLDGCPQRAGACALLGVLGGQTVAIVGPTGAGKSATLVYLIMQALAVWRPRVYLIEAGNSFGLMCDYLRAHALSVHSVTMQPNADVSLPPFAGALSLLETDPALANVDLEADDATTSNDDDPSDDLEGFVMLA